MACHKKLVLWIQDPRPVYEWDEINTVKLFTETCYYNQTIYDLVHNWYKQGRVRFISQAHFLNQKAIDLYSLDRNTDITHLPNPIEINKEFDIKNHQKQNKIIFLGRLESVKRGWLFCEIAKQLPEYQFYVLGQTFRESDKNKEIFAKYQQISNLHFVGHVEGDDKTNFLKDTKILVNTSIHEALPISFLEALSYGTLIVSNRNPDDLTIKFGIYVGDVLGDGFDKVYLYVNAIRKLMADEQNRQHLSIQAIKYVQENHNIEDFQKDLRDVLQQVCKTDCDIS
ncbi:glycosyltransferase family 4 protein [Moraxella bovis]|uniref:glycosyltransferase family 4 protein n=1 Tax=Moraxella bovis TaxID=476 RepID=UPI002226815B|nr:glycosyltransferase family 4 protein [Moraxella bovis]UYZ69592.1 glycosyltransferase family 4 protein [Moraxella bovis]UYZ71964.1 glycosyltransferase family 4 protein [Moraxella bovis]UYZ72126.1 glycosyltransferase family 4 protein [Moraxella bovis]UZA15264.1 glycosyltransferase family 4 protein [Moraxella bovis]UZA26381.1 glycosyltransferase family 4 protein [Moraxella bovis]